MVSKFAKSGNPNVQHCDLMLRAEQAALDRKYAKADELYKEAIMLGRAVFIMPHSSTKDMPIIDFKNMMMWMMPST